MPIQSLNALLTAVSDRPKKRVVVAAAHDAHTLQGIEDARRHGLVEASLVGDEHRIRTLSADLGIDISSVEILHEPEDALAAALAVRLVREGRGHFLMKGALQTATLVRAILDHQHGLMEGQSLLCHVALLQCPVLDRLLVASDAAVIPSPDLPQKVILTQRVIETLRLLGVEQPRVALVSITEKVNPKLKTSVEAAAIAQMARNGHFPNAYVEGPLPLDAALDLESARIKHVEGEVGGRADGLIFPDIEAGNIFYKACTKLAGAEVAGMVVGAKAPCVVSSRGDSSLAKLNSIALAALASR
jgi:phosphate butyryltransferase